MFTSLKISLLAIAAFLTFCQAALAENGKHPFKSSPPAMNFFEQAIDHTEHSPRLFNQLYYESLGQDPQSENQLKFLFIGGQAPLSEGTVSLTFMSQLGDKFIADKYALEHRYYGISQPMEDLSADSLQYLSIEQAIEDIASFIKYINNKQTNRNTKWILFGYSYAGNLAAWTRATYPNLVYGAITSGAPFQSKENFLGYLSTINKIMVKSNQNCSKTVQKGIKTVINYFKGNNKKQLKDAFKMCQAPSGPTDKYTLVSYIADLFSESALYNIVNNGTNRMDALCQDLTNGNGNEFSKLGSIVAKFYSQNKCFDYTYKTSPILDDHLDIYNIKRQKLYQQCTQLGNFQTTDASAQPFAKALPLSYYIQFCQDAFGKSFNSNSISKSIAATNKKYNVKKLRATNNIVVINGENDPWKELGISSFANNKSQVFEIKGGWHCQDAIMATSNDSQELKGVREKIQNILENWTMS